MAKPSLINKVPMDVLEGFLAPHSLGSLLTLKVKPNAKKECLLINEKGELTLSVRAVAVDNAANARVLELLSEVFLCPKSRLEIVSGATSRIKRVLIKEKP